MTPQDVQFIMPASLVPPELARACWSPDLLESWKRGEETTVVMGISPEEQARHETMQESRRTVSMILKRVSRETERMCGRMMGGSLNSRRVGGIEAVWAKFASENEDEGGTVTAAQAAEYILNVDGNEDRIVVRPNTLPAYAAHVLMMRKPDLFLGDHIEMWATGLFYVRSRAERRRLEEVQRVIEGETEQDKHMMAKFVNKAQKAIELSRRSREEDGSRSNLSEIQHSLPEWTSTERNILATVLAPMYETRSTQLSSYIPLATAIVKAIDPYPDEVVDRPQYMRLLQEVGAVRPWDNLKLSEAKANEWRARAMAGTQVRGSDELLRGDELDDLREDFTSQRVFVVDDATASELDDGLAIERVHGSDDVWLHVHIADPTRYLAPSHPAAIQASFRGSSIYLPGGCHQPLLPLAETMKELSLGAKVSRGDGAQGVMTFSSRLDLDGVVKDSKVRLGWIKNPRVITYHSVDVALGIEHASPRRPFGRFHVKEGKPSIPIEFSAIELDDLRLLRDFATACNHQRLATAGLEHDDLPQASIEVISRLPPTPDNLYDPVNLPRKPQFFAGAPIVDYVIPTTSPAMGATRLITEFMILAGRTAAAFCHSRNIPVPYRFAPAPTVLSSNTPDRPALTIDDLLASRDPVNYRVDFYQVMSGNFFFPPGGISSEPKPHWNMGFDKPDFGYVRVTSPLRRYDDLLVHWQIRAALAKEKGLGSVATAIPASDIQSLGVRADLASKRIRKASKATQTFWEAGFFASRLDGPTSPDEKVDLSKPFIGRIAGPTIFGSTLTTPTSSPVYIPDLGTVIRLDGDGRLRVPLKVGSEVRLKITTTKQWPNPIVNSILV